MCVLLVEDEPLIRELMAESLEDAGYDVVQASRGDEAIGLILDPATALTAVVTDFHMPGDVDGARVATCVRERFPAVPVVIASGRPDDVLRRSWQAQNGWRLLKKPYVPDQLVGMLKELLSPPCRPAG